MVQQQMLKAAQAMAAKGVSPPASDQQPRDPAIAQLGLAAMIAAREENCACRASQFLRKQSDLIMTSMWKAIADVAGPEEISDAAPPVSHSAGGEILDSSQDIPPPTP